MTAKIVVLGGNFAGLSCAQHIRHFCGSDAKITVIDRRDQLLFIPNILTDVFQNKDPGLHQLMPLRPILASDGFNFIQGQILDVDVDSNSITYRPDERPGCPIEIIGYDYIIIALGARLDYEAIQGFDKYGHTVSDLFHGQRLRSYLFDDGYKGGPIVIGAARFRQGDGAKGIQPYPGGSIPTADAACEGPPLELCLSMASWLKGSNKGNLSQITLFTPGMLIAADAGKSNAQRFVTYIQEMGINYKTNVHDVTSLHEDGIEFADGTSTEAEIKLILPNWRPHDFLRELPICDSEGFIITDLFMRNPQYQNVFAAGDCASVTVPKLGSLGHLQAEVIGRQLALDLGKITNKKADRPYQPVVVCFGDMSNGLGFYIRSDKWYGGNIEEMEIGHVPHQLKMRYRDLFFLRKGKVPNHAMPVAEFVAEHIKL